MTKPKSRGEVRSHGNSVGGDSIVISGDGNTGKIGSTYSSTIVHDDSLWDLDRLESDLAALVQRTDEIRGLLLEYQQAGVDEVPPEDRSGVMKIFRELSVATAGSTAANAIIKIASAL